MNFSTTSMSDSSSSFSQHHNPITESFSSSDSFTIPRVPFTAISNSATCQLRCNLAVPPAPAPTIAPATTGPRQPFHAELAPQPEPTLYYTKNFRSTMHIMKETTRKRAILYQWKPTPVDLFRDWPAGVRSRTPKSAKLVFLHPRKSIERRPPEVWNEPLIRHPVHRCKRRGRPRLNPLTMMELQENIGEERIYQGDRSLRCYLEKFVTSIEDLGKPTLEKDVAKLFIDGLRLDIFQMVLSRDHKNSLDRLAKTYSAARKADFMIRHPH